MSRRLVVLESQCDRCALAQGRTHVVVGRGSDAALVMFLGEAPGRQEDRTGLGFQGAAGQRFNEILAFVGLNREDIWLANAVRCRPSIEGRRNRAPKPDEIAACRDWLVRDIERVKPRVIVTMGRVAFESAAGEEWDASRRAQPIGVDDLGLYVYALYHPAYLIYRRALYETYRDDLMRLRRFLQEQQVPLGESSGSWK